MCNKLSSGSNMNKSELGDSCTKMKRKYRSSYVQYICLTICVIGMLYIKLRNEYEIHTASGTQNNNVYLRNLSELQKGNHYCSLRNTNSPDNSKKNKVKNNLTDNNDKRKLGNNKDKRNNNDNNNNKGKQNSINKRKTENIPITMHDKILSLTYNDLSRKYTKEQMKNIIDALQNIPPRRGLENIWNHTLKTANIGRKKLGNELKAYEKKYGECYEYRPNSRGYYKPVLIKQPDEFNERLKIHAHDYTIMFYELIDGDHTLDDLKNYLNSFLEGFENLMNLLFNKYKIKFQQKNMEIPTLDTIYDTKNEDDKEEGKKEDDKEEGENEDDKEEGENEDDKEEGKKEDDKEEGKKEEVKKGGKK
ncbi:Plasmodium exported protein (PHISTa), unknown function [Plasmodium reichenowi]|uniref:Plasmodium RESA N-terminal domain-containing protein n=1 Tax=Plasmodium reichenowi TaxID=5854 RepID=A0A060RNU9_PLARE|nr:Plasmodium exported protein (PHISTa), unknown function [Plasmodium reichenowi]